MKKIFILLICTFCCFNMVFAEEPARDSTKLTEFFEQRNTGLDEIVNNENTVVRSFKISCEQYNSQYDKIWVRKNFIFKFTVPKKDCYFYDESESRPYSKFRKEIPIHLINNEYDVETFKTEINSVFYDEQNIHIDMNSVVGYCGNAYVLIGENGSQTDILSTLIFCKNSSFGDDYFDIYSSKGVYIKPGEYVININCDENVIKVNGEENQLTDKRVTINGENYISQRDFEKLYNKYNKSNKKITLEDNQKIVLNKNNYVTLRTAINYTFGDNAKFFYDNETKDISIYCNNQVENN